MIITQITLDNIKSHHHTSVRLGVGTTAIRGHNGAGKSTIVEAIGFALFDWLPYSPVSRFVREGERSGKVVVTFISSIDGRPYEVERRVGGAWFVTDPETNVKLADGRDDVIACLRQHAGLESTLTLEDLFVNAIAVPQGTFTADFSQTAANRKRKFDALLQVEDYRRAAEQLRDTERYLKDEIARLKEAVAGMAAQTAGLDSWRAEHGTLGTRMTAIASAIAAASAEQSAVQREREAALATQSEIQRLGQEAERARGQWQTAVAQAQGARDDAARTARARELCAQHAADHERFVAAERALTEARGHQQTADALRLAIARDEESVASNEAHILSLDAERVAAASAAAERDRLTPLVERQAQLEGRQQAAAEASRRLATLATDSAHAARDQAEEEQRLTASQEEIAHIEALAPLAALLPERRAREQEIAARLATLAERRKHQAKLREQLARLDARVAIAATAVAEATQRVAATRDLAAEASTLAHHERDLAGLDAAIAALRAAIERDESAMHSSQGGMCPFLKEPCQNMRQRGMTNLEEYFSAAVARQTDQLYAAHSEREAIQAEVARLRGVASSFALLADREREQAAAEERHRSSAQEADLVRGDLAAIASDDTDEAELKRQHAEAKRVWEESSQADRQRVKLPTLIGQRDQSAARIADLTTRAAQRATEIEAARAIAAEAEAIAADLATLDDPRRRSAECDALARGEANIIQQIAAQQHALSQTRERLAECRRQLAPFADLAARIASLTTVRAATAAAHETFLRNEAEAQRDPGARERAATLAQAATTAELAFLAAQSALDAKAATFDEARLATLQQRLDALTATIADSNARLEQSTTARAALEVQIAEGERQLDVLRVAERERDEREETLSLLSYCRETIKEAGPFVMRALLGAISAAANRIYGDIMGDRSATLAWQDDYDIIVRHGANERKFAQLSGGEQMSAALAVRLALLRTLTNSSLVLLDEPTQNMDADRRANLAEQIRRVRDFEQVIVISHDDTFEEGLDAVVHVSKDAGESLVDCGDEALASGAVA